MAQQLKPGERVTVSSELHLSSKSPAFKQGLKKIVPGDIGEVVGTADGRALTVKFNGIETAVSKQRLQRLGATTPQKPAAAPQKLAPAPKKPALAGKKPAPRPAAKAPASSQPPAAKQSADASEETFAESGLELLNTVANKMLLKGGTKVDTGSVVELSLKDLPPEVQRRLQALIDAKLAFNPKSLGKK